MKTDQVETLLLADHLGDGERLQRTVSPPTARTSFRSCVHDAYVCRGLPRQTPPGRGTASQRWHPGRVPGIEQARRECSGTARRRSSETSAARLTRHSAEKHNHCWHARTPFRLRRPRTFTRFRAAAARAPPRRGTDTPTGANVMRQPGRGSGRDTEYGVPAERCEVLPNGLELTQYQWADGTLLRAEFSGARATHPCSA